MAMMVVVAEKLVTFKRLFAKTAAKKISSLQKKTGILFRKIKNCNLHSSRFFSFKSTKSITDDLDRLIRHGVLV